MSALDSDGTCPSASTAFLLGSCPAATALLYRLLCLHPEVAYISRLEHRLAWLPATVSGRIRLRRYSSKLRWWFRDVNGGRVQRALVRQMAPVEGEGVYRHPGLPPERMAGRLRERFTRLQEASAGRVLVSCCGADPRRIPPLEVIFPQARYLNVLCDVPGGGGPSDQARLVQRELRAIPSARTLSLRYEDLVEEPIEQMRRVLGFLGLERRLDYEWALKTLKLGAPGRGFRHSMNGRSRGAENGQSESLAPPGYVS